MFRPDWFRQIISVRYMNRALPLPLLSYGLLALGDRNYDAFCGFGRQLHQWLRSCGARSLFEPVEVDDEDADALACWHDRVTTFIRARTAVPMSAPSEAPA